jgi:hypothetical protein
MADHYCEAFFVQPGRCWRMVMNPDGTGHPMHCPELVEWRGRFKDGRGRWHLHVESRDGLADGLLNVRQVTAPVPF